MGFKQDTTSGLWTVYFSKRHPGNGMPISLRRKGIKTLAEAKRVEKELVAEVHDRLKEKLVPKWRDATQAFLKSSEERGLGKKTLAGYAALLEGYTGATWGERRVDEISTQEIRELIRADAGDKSQLNQRNILQAIRGVFAYALDCGWIQRNPVPQMHFRAGAKLKAVLTKEQARQFLEKAKDLGWKWYPHCALALYTGMRNGELFALTWDKVNLTDRQIKVDTSWNSIDGFKCTKSGDDRILEIAPPLLPMLKELKLRAGDSPFVLPRIANWERGEQARELRRFLVGIGMQPLRFHDLRASWATLLLGQGVEPIRVMTMAGWKDLKTMAYYIRKAGVDIKGATDGLILHNPNRESATVLSFERA